MRKLLLLLPVLLLTSCFFTPGKTRAPFACEHIASLQRQVGTDTSIEALRDSIQGESGLPLERIEARIADGSVVNADATHYVTWTDQRKLTYRAYLHDRQVIEVRVDNTEMSGGQLLACLGQPEQYYADSSWIEPGPVRDIYLFFPRQGIMAKGRQTFRGKVDLKQIPGVDDQFPFDDLTIVKPQSVEQIVAVGWGDYGRVMLQKLRPWPGEWVKMEIPPFPE